MAASIPGSPPTGGDGLSRLSARPASLSADGASARVPRPAFAWKTRVLLPVGLLVAFVAVMAYAARGALLPAKPVRVVPVVLQSGGGGSVGGAGAAGGVVTQATGWVEPDPFPIIVNALTDGVVREVLVLEGDRIEANQPVARLIDDDARLALAAAEAELARAVAERDSAQRRWENPTDRREAVAVAAAGVAELESELAALEPQIEAEAARAQELAELYAQIERARATGAGSETELITARQRLAAQRATFTATRARRPILEAQLRRAGAQLTAAEENARLRIEEAGALATAEAGVMQAEARRGEAALRLERMMVRAPAGGVVMTLHAEAGAKVMLGMDDPLSATIVRLYDPQRLQVRVDVPLADAGKVGVGMEAEVIVGVLPDRAFRGRVTRVVNEADVARNTLQVKVAIQEPDQQFKPEMLARVRFLAPAETGEADGQATGAAMAVWAPEALLEIQGDGVSATALVVDETTGTAQRRDVVLGRGRRQGWIEVASGLRAGDRLIADAGGIEAGERVRVVGEADLSEGGGHGVH